VHSYDDFVLGQLVEDGLVSPDRLREAHRAASPAGSALSSLIDAAVVTARDVAIARAAVCETPYVDLSWYDIDYMHAQLLPRAFAERHAAFPLFVLGDQITVGMADPFDLRAVDRLRSLLRADVRPVLCEESSLRALIARAYSLTAGRDTQTGLGEADSSDSSASEEPIVAAVNQMIAAAIEDGASDIHLGPDEQDLHLRFRIDGSLHARQGPARSQHGALIQRLKVMASLDLTQTRRPQDGKFRFRHRGKSVDVRLSIIPTVWGENAVLRLLGTGAELRGFEELGFLPDAIDVFERAVAAPHGMVLVTGPTGSGKTTTLYTALKRLNTPDRNILTIEDPVEVHLPLIRQVQVNAEIGLTFPAALRSILRQDPDVVLLGEIRDEETAHIALQAALTGHLVLSTLHTNDAPGAITRLRDLGCPGFAINAAVLAVLAQRLLKRNCPDCSQPKAPDERALRLFGIDADDHAGFREGAGCPRCMGTGLRGRMVVSEVFACDGDVRRLIDGETSTTEIRRAAIRAGMTPMWQDGVRKARMGLTTLDQVRRAVPIALEERAPQHHQPGSIAA
jgi:type IV pilus assembly protein PilB